jgi:hypothetical protein
MNQEQKDNAYFARKLASLGLAVFPCGDDKRPKRGIKWRDESTTELAKVEEWWSESQDALPAIDLGKTGLIVLDADRHGGPDGVAAIEKLFASCSTNLAEVPTVITPSGGRHYYFKQPNREPLGNARGSLPNGIDVRGAGGYVIAPGAQLPDGRRYTWEKTSPNIFTTIRERTQPGLPEGIAELIRRNGHAHDEAVGPDTDQSPSNDAGVREQAYAAAALDGCATELASKPHAPSGRNELLNVLAFRMGTFVAREWIDRSQVFNKLLDAARACGLVKDDGEVAVRKTLKSGLDAGMREPCRNLDRDSYEARPFNEERKAREGDSIKKGWPDPHPLPSTLLPVESFDFDLLPNKLRARCADVSERMQCPADFVGVSLMAAAGSMIGRKVGIRPKDRDDWTVIANQWALLIGRPGILKSPAMEEALRPLKRLSVRAETEFKTAQANYQATAKVAKLRADVAHKEAAKQLAKDALADVSSLLKIVPQEEEPTLKRYIANDTNVASLGVLLQQNPNGLLVFRDELVSLLDALDREENVAERGFYLTGWQGDSRYTFDRIGRGLHLSIDGICLSLLGSTQPGRIAQYLSNAVRGGRGDDGLIQRFGLLVWPEVSGKWQNVDRWPDKEARDCAFGIFDRLDKLDWRAIGAKRDMGAGGEEEGLPYLRFGTDAHDIFADWRANLERRLRTGELHPALESHLAKYRKLVPSLALICHLADGGTGPVGVDSIKRGIAWANYLESHGRRAYGSATAAEADTARLILAKIKAGQLNAAGFSSREVWRPGWSRLTDSEAVKAGLAMLVEYDHLTARRVETEGRTAVVYAANPKALKSESTSHG